jgi:hypothetical protein
VSQALARIRQAARQRKKEKFTALLHHISVDLLDEAFFDLKEDAAGVFFYPKGGYGEAYSDATYSCCETDFPPVLTQKCNMARNRLTSEDWDANFHQPNGAFGVAGATWAPESNWTALHSYAAIAERNDPRHRNRRVRSVAARVHAARRS